MPTSISDLWVPDIWIPGINEKMNSFPALISSPLALRTPFFDSLATGPGQTVNIPYFRDITGQSDSIQVENTQPTRQVIGSGKQIAPIFNRVTANDATALAHAAAGPAPIEAITTQLTKRRQKQRQTTLLNICRGLFDNASAPSSSTGCLKTVRNDIFSETGASPAAAQCISVSAFVDTVAFLGELADTVMGGGIAMHPLIRAALLKQDQISFEHYSTQEGVRLERYKGLDVFTSNQLVRNGTTSGKVFDTYIFAPGVFAWGEKQQVADVVDVASLTYWPDKQKNNEELYDRTRYILHPNGCRWVGSPSGQSATDAELATASNWNLDYTTADRVGIVCLRSNG